MKLLYSFIIPVYNRPDEVAELLESMEQLQGDIPFEVVLVEDGSTQTSEAVVDAYKARLDIAYFYKENSGPGASRNYGMHRAKGSYFIILDSDCILPPSYLVSVQRGLEKHYTDCFGGPDAAHSSFSDIQKAINYSMTAPLTTGGIRGGKHSVGKFQPRSFNMGLSKKAFQATQGFGSIHPGEDPDLTIRLWNAGFQTQLLPEAFVYHKRRISWEKFMLQVKKFGMTRPILNSWHPHTKKITYWFPTLFMAGLLFAILCAIGGFYGFLAIYALYFIVLFVDAFFRTKRIKIAFLALYATIIQFVGYGWGFVKSTILITFSSKKPEELFPKLFFRVHDQTSASTNQ